MRKYRRIPKDITRFGDDATTCLVSEGDETLTVGKKYFDAHFERIAYVTNGSDSFVSLMVREELADGPKHASELLDAGMVKLDGEVMRVPDWSVERDMFIMVAHDTVLTVNDQRIVLLPGPKAVE